jgi:Protein-arginine deiminase (PAD)/FlgD Ig-like domain
MSKPRTTALLVSVCICLLVGIVYACSVFYISVTWNTCTVPGVSADITAVQTSGDNGVYYWTWSWPTEVSGDYYGSSGSSTATVSGNTIGKYMIEVEAETSYSEYDYDYGYLYVCGGEIKDSTQDSILLSELCNPDPEEDRGMYIYYELLPSDLWYADENGVQLVIRNSSGGTVETFSSLPRSSGTAVGIYWDGRDGDGDDVIAGTYTVELTVTKNGDDHTDTYTIAVTNAVGVVLDVPSSFPAYTGVGSAFELQLGCTASGAGGGTFSWTKVSGPGTVTFSSATSKDPTFSADQAGDYVVQVAYAEGGDSVTDTSGTITVVGVDITTPSSFPAYVDMGDTLSLGCTAAGATGGTYVWSKVSGPGTVTFSPSASSEDPTFSVDQLGDYVVQVEYTVNGITVSDISGTINAAHAVTVVLDVPSSFPVYTGVGNALQLGCTYSGGGGSFSWTKVSGPGTVTFSPSATTAYPTFSADQAGNYVAQVEYTEGGRTDSDTSGTITVVAVDITAPLSFPAYVAVGSPLQLGGTPLGATGGTYSWTKVSGPGTVTFSPSASSESPTFTADQPGEYTVQVEYAVGGVTVSDVSGTITAVAVDVTMPSSFPASVELGDTLSLGCTAAGATGGTYVWSKVSGPGTVTFSPSASSEDPTFSADQPGDYVVQVQYTVNGITVSDISGTITVTNAVDVVLDVPSSLVFTGVGDALQLGCTASGAGGGSFSWTKVSGPGAVTFSPSASSEDPTFSADQSGNYVVQVAYDEGGTPVTDTSGTITVVAVDITTPSSFPVSVELGDTLSLGCTAAGATDGTYLWSKVSGPGTVSFSPSASSENPTFAASQTGDYTVRVTYSKGGATVVATSGTITVSPLAVDIITPQSFPVSTPSSVPVSLECQTSGSGGTITWSAQGPGVVTWSPSDPTNSMSPTFSADQAGEYTIQVDYAKSNDLVSASASDSGTITVADAVDVVLDVPSGYTLAGVGDAVQLGCTASGAGGGSFSWTKVSGPGNVTFSPSASSEDPTFSVDQAGNYVVQVAYTEGGTTVTDTFSDIIKFVAVDITTPSSFPAYVAVGSPLQLGSTPQGAIDGTYSWSKVSGPGTVTFSPSASSEGPTFSADQPGDYVVQVEYTWIGVTVSDVSGTITVTSAVDVVLDAPSSFPVFAGVGNVVQLGCTASGAGGGTFSWTKVSGPGNVTFSPSATSEDPTFSADQPGNYVVQVAYTEGETTVTDASGAITAVAVDITTPSSFPAYVAVGSPLQLGGMPLGATGGTYSWTKVSGPGTVTFSPSAGSESPTFTADQAGDYTVQVQYTVGGVTVSDVSGTLTVTEAVAVVLDVPSSTVFAGVDDDVQLGCTASGAGGGSFSWTKVSGPGNVTFSPSATSEDPTLSVDQGGNYVVQVAYTEGGTTVTDTSSELMKFVGVEITTPSSFPAYVAVGTPLQLVSTPQGAIDGLYSWSKVSGPGNVTFSPSAVGYAAENPTFTADQPGDYTVKVEFTFIPGVAAGSDISGTITVTNAVGVVLDVPSGFVFAGLDTPLQLGCTASGAGGGSFSWTKVSGLGNVTFSPSATSEDPTFSADQSGNYVVQVAYTEGDPPVSDISDTIRVIAVDITTPSSFPAYVVVGSPLQLGSTPQGAIDGTYSWSKVSGPGTVTFSPSASSEDPTFSADQPGDYVVQVQYTWIGITVNDISGTITVWTVDLDVDSNRDGEIQGTPEEDALEESQSAIVPVNIDDDNQDSEVDSKQNVIDNELDIGDLTQLVIRRLPPGWTATLSLESGNDGKLRVFNGSDYWQSGDPVWYPGLQDPGFSYPILGSRGVYGTVGEYQIPDASSGDLIYYVEALEFWSSPSDVEWELLLTVADGVSTYTDQVVLRPSPFILLPGSGSPQTVYAPSRSDTDLDDDIASVGGTIVSMDQGTTYAQDPWLQDAAEIGYTKWPGGQMHVVLDLPRGRALNDWPMDSLLAPSIGVFEIASLAASSPHCGGNIEATGEVTYGGVVRKCGVVVMGAGTSSDLTDFITAQGIQPVVTVGETAYLAVGHIDELVSFTGGNGALVADVDLGVSLIDGLLTADQGSTAFTSATQAYIEVATANWTTDEWAGAYIEVSDTQSGVLQNRQVISNDATRVYVYDAQSQNGRVWDPVPNPSTCEYSLIARSEFRVVFFEGAEDFGVVSDIADNGRTALDSSGLHNFTAVDWVTDGYAIVNYVEGGVEYNDRLKITATTTNSFTLDDEWLYPGDRYILVQKSKRNDTYGHVYMFGSEGELACRTVRWLWSEFSADQGAWTGQNGRIANLKSTLSFLSFTGVPALFENEIGASAACALFPGMVNLLNTGTYNVPKPFGPRDATGQDLLEDAFPGTPNFVDCWPLHSGIGAAAGEIHCGTNAKRAIPASNWWDD